MTIYELSQQLHSISLNGYFNGEKFTVDRLRNYIEAMTRMSESVIMEGSSVYSNWITSVMAA